MAASPLPLRPQPRQATLVLPTATTAPVAGMSSTWPQ